MPTEPDRTTDLDDEAAWQAHNAELRQIAEDWAQLCLNMCQHWDKDFPEHAGLLYTVLCERLQARS